MTTQESEETAGAAAGEEDLERRIHRLERIDRAKDGAYVAPTQQVLKHAEKQYGRKAKVAHMGSSSLGLNLNLDDAGREAFIQGLMPNYRNVLSRVATAKSVRPVDPEIVDQPSVEPVLPTTRIDVVPQESGWAVRCGDETLATFHLRDDAIEWARSRVRDVDTRGVSLAPPD